eukprot:UN25964
MAFMTAAQIHYWDTFCQPLDESFNHTSSGYDDSTCLNGTGTGSNTESMNLDVCEPMEDGYRMMKCYEAGAILYTEYSDAECTTINMSPELDDFPEVLPGGGIVIRHGQCYNGYIADGNPGMRFTWDQVCQPENAFKYTIRSWNDAPGDCSGEESADAYI